MTSGVDPNLEYVLDKVFDKEVLFILAGAATLITWAVFGSIASIFKSFSRERTRREVAAYIAEGSMSPDQGERIMKAKEPDD
ncbi:MAG: hypothetical protein H6815_05765 [Phycisphaeraceae bacterium]|nr:hypothetical protein [Phycisphaerales bacterium]MCB9859945.1 hypothetical protein [Phycisphaeraceae bacterium]